MAFDRHLEPTGPTMLYLISFLVFGGLVWFVFDSGVASEYGPLKRVVCFLLFGGVVGFLAYIKSNENAELAEQALRDQRREEARARAAEASKPAIETVKP